jgi:N-acetylmuramoyl-L-alanine amidase
MKSPRFIVLLLLLVLALAAPVFATTVVVDAGHGGIDRGGQPGQRATEKTYTLAIAQKLAARLRGAGYNVVMTRSGDYFVGLGQRCAIANAQGNAIFVSIHLNAAPRVGATGVETYYYSGRSAGLAGSVHQEVVRLMGTEDRHVRQRGFYVIRHTSCPAILVESGFLTNPEEAARLGSPSFQESLAAAIVRGIAAKYH